MAFRFGTPPPGVVLQEELESVQKRDARFVTGNYNYETRSMTGILVQLKWESLKKRRKDNRLIYYIKVLKVKPVYQQMTLSPKLGVVEISTLWHFRLPLPIQMFIKVVSSPRLSGIGMPSPILWSHPLKMQRIVLLSLKLHEIKCKYFFPGVLHKFKMEMKIKRCIVYLKIAFRA